MVKYLLVAVAGIVVAQSKPDFSGTWKLNLAESDYSAPAASKPDELIRIVHQKGDQLKFKMERQKAGRKVSFEVELTIGGPPFESDAAGVVTAEWSGRTLVVSYLYNPGSDRQSDANERWTLSGDGRLVDEFTAHPPKNGKEVHVRRVFDRQK